MWHSDAGEGHSNGHSNSYSNSNSSSKLPSSSSSSTPRTTIMEEVWKDINLPSLYHESRPSTPSLSLEPPVPHKSFRGMTMQDFFAGAFGDAPALPPTFLSLSSSGDLPPGFVCSDGIVVSKKVAVDERSGGDGDRRLKRMIKNRESAARSRARKQAGSFFPFLFCSFFGFMKI